METECYPCIPLQSASNQRASASSSSSSLARRKRKLMGGETVSIKPEPLSPGSAASEVNVVDHDDEQHAANGGINIRGGEKEEEETIEILDRKRRGCL